MYATCSILPSENQEQVQRFLTTEIGQQFNFIKDQKIWLRKVVLMDSIWLCSRERIVKNSIRKIIPIDNIKKLQFSINWSFFLC
jgi:16S rRNA C967 or C1407 C5-methylase (RsmB/RsmF family)